MTSSRKPAPLPEVRKSVRDLLSRSAAFARLPPARRAGITRDTVAIANDLLPADEDFAGQVDFPTFVTALVTGVFNAVVDSSIRQMEAYADLIASVTASLEQFRDENVTEEAVRERLCKRFPRLCDPPTREEQERVAKALAAIAGGTWRRLAKQRQQLLATMVLLGINRCVAGTSRLTR